MRINLKVVWVIQLMKILGNMYTVNNEYQESNSMFEIKDYLFID